ncbi:hypothetical protein E2P65_00955 [Candidatus Bathyarchaeota archaeon]|nr:hypothetical protein E2P65_00955 [Candidatus Bathyarchaeota archaeon]
MRRYKDMNTDLDALYKDVVKELQNEKELNVGKELKGDINGVPFMSITANRASIPKMVTGTLREVTVTITGESNDYLIEMHTGEWLSNLAMPYLGASILVGPLAGLAAAGTTGLMAANYGRKLKNRIKELVKKHSKAKYSDEKVETFI